jgi:ribonuclease HII
MVNKDFKIAGIDEAGRGALIGPLIVVGVCLLEDKIQELRSIGARDSKAITPGTRNRLYPLILHSAERVSIVKVSPTEIDRYVFETKKLKKLNYLEALSMKKIIDELSPDRVYVDSPDTDAQRFGSILSENLSKRIEIISTHHADSSYIIVSAASIMAKVIRDKEVAVISQEYGDFGSGYPSDKKTIYFLKNWIKEHNGEIPFFVRKSWKTVKRLKKITDYF